MIINECLIYETERRNQAYSDKIRSNPRRDLFLISELGVGGGRRVDNEGLRVSDVGEVACKLQAVNDLASGLGVSLHAEAEDSTKSISPQQLKRKLVRLV
jgi:hypothetical protein